MNHIGSAVNEIIRYTQIDIHPVTLYKDKHNSLPLNSGTIFVVAFNSAIFSSLAGAHRLPITPTKNDLITKSHEIPN